MLPVVNHRTGNYFGIVLHISGTFKINPGNEGRGMMALEKEIWIYKS